MRRSSIIGHAVELLDLVRASRLSADLVVRDFFRTRHYLGAKDRRGISTIVYSVLRRQLLLEAFARGVFARLSGPGGAVPSIALIVTDTVRLNGEDANAVLLDTGSFLRLHLPSIAPEAFISAIATAPHPAEGIEDPIRAVALRHAFPLFLVREWSAAFGAGELEHLCSSLNEEAPVVIRVNTLRATREVCEEALRSEGLAVERTRWSPLGLVLPKRVNARSLRSYLDGWFELQDEGSQLIGFLAGPAPGMRVIDACAGAGGKALQCAALMQNRGEILAIDNDERRLGQLGERAARNGVTIVRTAIAGNDDPVIRSWAGTADVVLVDAPCTGCGTLRRNPGLKTRLSEEEVERMSGTQRKILADYAPLVRPGGRLVYSTCSLHRAENLAVVDSFLNSSTGFRIEAAADHLQRAGVSLPDISSSTITLLPHVHGTDGFFLSSMVRAG